MTTPSRPEGVTPEEFWDTTVQQEIRDHDAQQGDDRG